MRFIVVKRSALWTYRCLEQSCRDIADLRVIWDRRYTPDRRGESEPVPVDRRAEDRRRPLPQSWDAAGHLLATPPLEGSPVGLADRQSYGGKLNV